MADDHVSAPEPTEPLSRWAALKQSLFGVSLSRVQSIVGTTAGVISIVGALFSVTPLARLTSAGQLVATVQDAATHRTVTDATVEVMTADNTIVATLTPDSSGRVTQSLKEGVYIVRVSHPRYAADVRRIQMQPRQTLEIKAGLRAGSSSPAERAVNDGMRAVRRALRF
jgi:hypothetical protein